MGYIRHWDLGSLLGVPPKAPLNYEEALFGGRLRRAPSAR